MKKRGGTLIKVLIAAAIIAAAVFFLWKRGYLAFPQAQKADPAQNLKTQAAYVGSIRETTEGNGVIEPSDSETFVSDYTVEISHVEAEEGDVVGSGDKIADIDADSIRDRIRETEAELEQMTQDIVDMTKGGSSSVTASVAGRVKRIFVKKDDLLSEVVRRYGGVMELSVDGRLMVEFSSKKNLTPGAEVTVSFLNYEEEGRLESLGEGKYRVTIPDSSEYQVDTAAEVLSDSGEKLGEGTLLSHAPYLVDTRYGVCDGINVSVGNSVDAGATLLSRTRASYNEEYVDAVRDRDEKIRDLQALRALLDDPVLKAEKSGIISDIRLADRVPAAEGEAMYTIISTDEYWLRTQIDELDIADVAEGQKAEVVFDAFEDDTYSGTVEKVSALGVNTGGVTTYAVTVRMGGADVIKPGMSATATIVLHEKNDALLVPVDAVRTVDGERKVTVIRNGQAEERTVKTGMISSSLAEITEGVSEGDEVVVYEREDTDWMLQMMRRNASQMGGGSSPLAGGTAQ